MGETSAYRDFADISGTRRIPERVSILRFLHVLEAQDLRPRRPQVINAKLVVQGLHRVKNTLMQHFERENQPELYQAGHIR